MVIAGGQAVLVFGIILALVSGAPILGFLQGAAKDWLLASILLLVGTSVVVPLVFIPHRKNIDRLIDLAQEEGAITPQLDAAVGNRQVRIFQLLEQVVLVVIIYLMVAKPF